MDYELRRMMTEQVSFRLRGNSAYGPGTPTDVGPVDAYVETVRRSTPKGGDKQGQTVSKGLLITLDPADDDVLADVFASESAEVIVGNGDTHRILSVATFNDPETGLVDHYLLSC